MSNYVFVEDGLPNSVVPGELFLTSRTPSIVTDSEGVRMVVGGAGGAKIVYHVAWVSWLYFIYLCRATLTEMHSTANLGYLTNLSHSVPCSDLSPCNDFGLHTSRAIAWRYNTGVARKTSILRPR